MVLGFGPGLCFTSKLGKARDTGNEFQVEIIADLDLGEGGGHRTDEDRG